MLHEFTISRARKKPKTTPGAPRCHACRPQAQHSSGHLARARFAPYPTTPVPIERSRRAAPDGVRVAHGLEELLAHCPAKEGATGQQQGGANSVGQEGYHTAA